MKVQGKIPVKIDNDKYMEFLCLAADVAVEQASYYAEFDPLNYLEDGSTEYKPWAQDVFNAAYDNIETYLQTILGVFPDIKFVDNYKPVTSDKPWGKTCGGSR